MNESLLNEPLPSASAPADLRWIDLPAAVPDAVARREAEEHQGSLTKPPGALGQLESLAIRIAALQGCARPQVSRINITVFAGDHGIAAENVSAFPQAVTAEMIKNFATGGAAICVAARYIEAELQIINLGTVSDTGVLNSVHNCYLGPGTANFAHTAAMTQDQLALAMSAGREAVRTARRGDSDVFIGGEMGIANTTAAAALACALLQADPLLLAGPGTGLDSKGVQRKAQVIAAALALHKVHIKQPIDALRYFGGFEIAALTGAFISCAQEGLPVLVDGFITSVAALAATQLHPGVAPWLLFSHLSAEPGHRTVLDALDAKPLLDLGMRLGEGSGAAVAIPLLRLACALHNEMATFAEASVSQQASTAPGET